MCAKVPLPRDRLEEGRVTKKKKKKFQTLTASCGEPGIKTKTERAITDLVYSQSQKDDSVQQNRGLGVCHSQTPVLQAPHNSQVQWRCTQDGELDPSHFHSSWGSDSG